MLLSGVIILVIVVIGSIPRLSDRPLFGQCVRRLSLCAWRAGPAIDAAAGCARGQPNSRRQHLRERAWVGSQEVMNSMDGSDEKEGAQVAR